MNCKTVHFEQVIGHIDVQEQKKGIPQKPSDDRRKLIIAGEQKNRPMGKKY